jgi:hypothetical protein
VFPAAEGQILHQEKVRFHFRLRVRRIPWDSLTTV